MLNKPTPTTSPSPTAADDLQKLQAIYERVLATEESAAVFAEAVEIVDWQTKSPAEFERAIQMAMHLEMSHLARDLADRGHRLYPDDDTLAGWLKVFQPPRVVNTHLPAVKGLSASMRWLQEHAIEYSGSWIAIQEGKLLGTAPSLEALKAQLGDLVNRHTNILMGRIP